MLNNEDRATVDPSITVFRLPPWAHLQVQCADTELQLDKQELERVHREQTRVRDRLDARKRSVVRMRLENCADEEERWSSATMVLSIPLAKSGHGAAAVASPGTVDRTPIIATTTLYHG